MKYNKREIMMNAWTLIKRDGINRSTAMKSAWALAKAEVEANRYMEEDCNYCGHKKVVMNDWTKYGKSRTYVSVKVWTNAWNLKREIKLGYVDNMTGEYIAA